MSHLLQGEGASSSYRYMYRFIGPIEFTGTTCYKTIEHMFTGFMGYMLLNYKYTKHRCSYFNIVVFIS